MADYANRQRLLGNLVHSAVTQDYLVQHRRQHVIADTLVHAPHGLPYAIADNWHDGRPRDAYLGMLLELLQTRKPSSRSPLLFPHDPSLEGFSRRPEMANVEEHVAYEIKPDSSRWEREGSQQLHAFLGLLRRADLEFRSVRDKRLADARSLSKAEAERIDHHYGNTLYDRCVSTSWRSGTWRPNSPITLYLGIRPVLVRLRLVSTGGLILWKELDEEERDRYRSPFLVPIPVSGSGDRQSANDQRHASNQFPPLRLSERLAARLREEVRLLSHFSERTALALLLRLTELRQLLVEFLRCHGQTMLLSALTSALVVGIVLSPPLAAAFAALIVVVLMRERDRERLL